MIIKHFIQDKIVSRFRKNNNRVSARYQTYKSDAINSFYTFSKGGEFPKWPLEIFLEISNVCDLKCAMCMTFSALNPHRTFNIKKSERGFIDMSFATDTIEPLLKRAIVVHAFGYGEPTIHPKFTKIIDYISKYEVMLDFFTHGMHLTEELCKYLVEKKIAKITISFSGATKEEYENIYIGGNFYQVLNNIRRLSDEKTKQKSKYPVIEINSLAFNEHIEKLPDFVEMMANHGVQNIHVKPLQTYDHLKFLHTHASIMRPDIEGKIIKKAKSIARKYNILLSTKPYESTAQINQNTQGIRQVRHKGKEKISEEHVELNRLKEISKSIHTLHVENETESSTCQSKKADTQSRYIYTKNTLCLEPFKTFYAGLNSNVFPCCFKNNKFAIGRLRDDDGKKVWNGPLFSDIRNHILKNEYLADLCKTCIKAGTYPKHHGINHKVGQYVEWFFRNYGVKIDRHLVRKSRKIPDNQHIFKNHS